MRKCLNCGKELKTYQMKFCSHQCQADYAQDEYILSWKNGDVDGRVGQNEMSKRIRNYMLAKADYKCEKCGWGEVNESTGKIPLQVHHIDGDYRNCIEENLQVLCPNCHSLTPNFGSLNRDGRGARNTRKKYCVDCGKPISDVSTRCIECQAKQRITDKPVTREELKELIRAKPFTKIGEMYGVSDNAVRKWCVRYELPTKKKDINAYSDEEWLNI